MTHCLGCMLSCLLVAFPQAGGQDPVTIKLKERGEGETSLITKTEASTFSLKIVDAKGKVLSEQSDKGSDTKEYAETVLKRVGTKLPTKLERTYTKAHAIKGGVALDWAVVGKPIVIEKKNDHYTFAFKSGGDLAGPVADALAKEFARKGESESEFERLMLPKVAVKPGESWKLDMAPIVKDLAKGGELDVSLANAKGVGTLVRTYTEGGRLFGVITYKLEVPLKALGAGPKAIKFNDTGKITLEATMDLCIDGGIESGTTRSRITISAQSPLPKSPGVTAVVHIVNDLTQIHRPAGK